MKLVKEKSKMFREANRVELLESKKHYREKNKEKIQMQKRIQTICNICNCELNQCCLAT